MRNFTVSLIQNIVKTSIVLVSLFSQSFFYLFYILFGIVGFFSNGKSGFISSFGEKSSFALITLSLFLLIVLNVTITRTIIEKWIGKPFLEKYLPGKGKGFLPFSLFLFTMSVLDCIEAISIHSRVATYARSVETIYQKMDTVTPEMLPEDVITSFQEVLLSIRDLPDGNFPSVGIVTDIGCYLSVF